MGLPNPMVCLRMTVTDSVRMSRLDGFSHTDILTIIVSHALVEKQMTDVKHANQSQNHTDATKVIIMTRHPSHCRFQLKTEACRAYMASVRALKASVALIASEPQVIFLPTS